VILTAAKESLASVGVLKWISPRLANWALHYEQPHIAESATNPMSLGGFANSDHLSDFVFHFYY